MNDSSMDTPAGDVQDPSEPHRIDKEIVTEDQAEPQEAEVEFDEDGVADGGDVNGRPVVDPSAY